MTTAATLFTPFQVKNLTLKNRITMTPLYLGYANPDGTVSPLLLDHYREMAASGASLIVVENAAVDQIGAGSPFTLRIDDDRFLTGLSDLAKTIHQEGALAFLQINHTGRYAYVPERIAPSLAPPDPEPVQYPRCRNTRSNSTATAAPSICCCT